MAMRQTAPTAGAATSGPTGTAGPTAALPARPVSERDSARKRRRLTRLVWGAAPLVVFLLIALIGPVVWPYDSVSVRTGDRLKAPLTVLRDGSTAPLGTDQVGRDLLA